MDEHHVHNHIHPKLKKDIINGRLLWLWGWGCKCGHIEWTDLLTEEQARERANAIRKSDRGDD